VIASFSSPRSSLITGTREHPPSSTDDLAGLLNCDKTNVTGLVGRVAKRDLVKRSIHLDDRRVTQVARTAQREELVNGSRSSYRAASMNGPFTDPRPAPPTN